MIEERSQPKPEKPRFANDSDTEPFYVRLWFKRTVLFLAVVVMLIVLGLLFSPRYWRF